MHYFLLSSPLLRNKRIANKFCLNDDNNKCRIEWLVNVWQSEKHTAKWMLDLKFQFAYNVHSQSFFSDS